MVKYMLFVLLAGVEDHGSLHMAHQMGKNVHKHIRVSKPPLRNTVSAQLSEP
jgi:hypothetical protein